MNNEELKTLCLTLITSDSETEVIALLQKAGFWDRHECWRFYGDYESNYNTMGNQQSKPDAALVEKLVNSVDARLMNECLVHKIDPEGSKAPHTIREAVALFFESAINPIAAHAGLIREWSPSKRTEISRGITLAATGATAKVGNLCFTISDSGEGQTPDAMPNTLLSLNRSNKLRIPFVQGKFNMGGTGVLKFCGKRNLELIVSKRNPALLNTDSCTSRDMQWGFTIVRREDPEGNRRSSTYTYLAPIDADKCSNRGNILSFESKSLPIFPDGQNAYSRESSWGTLIKLFEYAATGYYKSHILRKDGILYRIDLLLPDIALPIRLHECRAYAGHTGSFDTTLTGIKVRLEDDKAENLEPDFPASAQMNVMGEEMMVTIYAFKKGRAETYRKNEGIIFVMNGQTHGHLTTDFFIRKKVGLSYLADSLLVTIDCSKLSGRSREDLFMNSRDRLSGVELKSEIEQSLEDLLKSHDGLRELKERRRREEIAAKLDDSKPLENILENLLQHSPILSALFLQGKRLSIPFKTLKSQSEEKPYEGKKFPSYFKFKGKNYTVELERGCHINMRCRILFETDAKNDYFSRDVDTGEFELSLLDQSEDISVPVHNRIVNLQNGIATLSFKQPEGVYVGQVLQFVSRVNDPSRIEPFINKFSVNVLEELDKLPKPSNPRPPKPPSNKEGQEREIPSGIQMPNIIPIFEAEWSQYNFDQYSALRIVNAGKQDAAEDDPDGPDIYDFFINMDNLYLKTELKSAGQEEPEIIRARFKYGLVLVGLALLQQDVQDRKKTEADKETTRERSPQESIEQRVEMVSKAIAPIIVPMIDSLGDLDLESSLPKNVSGEAT